MQGTNIDEGDLIFDAGCIAGLPFLCFDKDDSVHSTPSCVVGLVDASVFIAAIQTRSLAAARQLYLYTVGICIVLSQSSRSVRACMCVGGTPTLFEPKLRDGAGTKWVVMEKCAEARIAREGKSAILVQIGVE